MTKETKHDDEAPHHVDTHVGKRLRMRRTMMGLSQEAIARTIGITFQQIQKYERGVNRMSASRLYDFAKAMQVPVSYFFDGLRQAGDIGEEPTFAGVMEAGASFEHEDLTGRETMELMRAYGRVKEPALRKKIVDLIRAIADEKPILD